MAVGYAAVALLVIAAGWGVFTGGKSIVNGAENLREKQLAWVNRDAAPANEARDQAFNENNAVTLCDLNMQSQAIAQAAYRAAWSWRIERRGEVVAIRRNFTVTNPFGIEMPGEYACLVAATTNRIVGLQYESAGSMITIPGELLRQ